TRGELVARGVVGADRGGRPAVAVAAVLQETAQLGADLAAVEQPADATTATRARAAESAARAATGEVAAGLEVGTRSERAAGAAAPEPTTLTGRTGQRDRAALVLAHGRQRVRRRREEAEHERHERDR